LTFPLKCHVRQLLHSFKYRLQTSDHIHNDFCARSNPEPITGGLIYSGLVLIWRWFSCFQCHFSDSRKQAEGFSKTACCNWLWNNWVSFCFKRMKRRSRFSIRRAVSRELLELIEWSYWPTFPPTPIFPAIPDIPEPPVIPEGM
jgi:hypothetical protein